MGDVETVTVLFTDLVGSTELASRIGITPAEKLRAEHFAALRESFGRHGGEVVKNLGDGLMVTFSSAGAAVAGAAQAQQQLHARNRRADHQLAMRIGIALGDATREDGDYFGPPVVEAARLCAHAQGGQVLVNDFVRGVAAARSKQRFQSLGDVELKGLGAPLAVHAVAWEPVETVGAGSSLPLPPRLRGVPEISYVGRTAERARLDEALRRTSAGSPQLVLLSGDAGIGKTRLATHTSLVAEANGAVVLYGRCEEDVGVPCQPWVEALGHLVAEVPATMLERHVREHGSELTRLLPQIAHRVPDAPPPTQADGETERYLVFEAVAGLLARAATDAPVVVVLDDLHWSDRPTLLLLRHLLGQTAIPLLMIGTFRESDVTREHPLSAALAGFRREPNAERIELAGLAEDDVVELLEKVSGHPMAAEGRAFAAELTRETDGNPFFIAEILRNLQETGALTRDDQGRWRLETPLAELGLPQSVREVVVRRVDRLGEEARRVLVAAAVIGREFDLDVLSLTVDVDEERLLDMLDEAVQASVLSERGALPGRFHFAHALIEYTLYAELGGARRARMHRRVAEALERLHGDDPDDRLAELAHHWSRGAVAGERERAVDYATRAGRQALDLLAPDEAIKWFSRALELLEEEGRAEARRLGEPLLGLGEAQRQIGDAAFRDSLLAAARLGRDAGDADLLARAVLANTRGFSSTVGDVDGERVELLEAAARALPRGDARRAQVLALLAVELTFAGDTRRRRMLVDEAVAIARAAGDRGALARVLTDGIYAIWVPDTLPERDALSAELVELVDDLPDPLLRVSAYGRRATAALEACDGAEAGRWLERILAIGESRVQPPARWTGLWLGAVQPLLRGRLDQAEELAGRALQIAIDSGQPDALLIYAGQLLEIRFLQGRFEEVGQLLLDTLRDNPGLAALRGAVAWAHVEVGREADALELLEAEDWARLPHDFLRLPTLVNWVEPVVAVGASDRAEELLALIAPWADQQACSGPTAWGSLHHYAGQLSHALGRLDEAAHRLEAAEAANRALGAPVFLARTRCAKARVLIDRGEPGDADRAQALLVSAVSLVRGLGAGLIERDADAALAAAR